MTQTPTTQPDRSELGLSANRLLREAIACITSVTPMSVSDADYRLLPFESEARGLNVLLSRQALERYLQRLTVELLRSGLADAELLNLIADHFETGTPEEARKQLFGNLPATLRNPPTKEWRKDVRKAAAIDAYDLERQYLVWQHGGESRLAAKLAVFPVIAAYNGYFEDEGQTFDMDYARRPGEDDAAAWIGEDLVRFRCTRASLRLVDDIIPPLQDFGLELRDAPSILAALGFDIEANSIHDVLGFGRDD